MVGDMTRSIGRRCDTSADSQRREPPAVPNGREESHSAVMAEIVNLRRARKDKERRARDAEADANRRRFGRTRAEKEHDRDEAARAARDIDGKKLEPKR